MYKQPGHTLFLFNQKISTAGCWFSSTFFFFFFLFHSPSSLNTSAKELNLGDCEEGGPKVRAEPTVSSFRLNGRMH